MSKINWSEKLKFTKNDLEELRYVAYAYIRQGKYDIAQPLFEGLCALDSECVYDAQTLGAIYLQLGNYPKALKTLDRALKLEGDHSPTLLNLAKTLLVLGRKKEGLQLLQALKNEQNSVISSTAKALILAYS